MSSPMIKTDYTIKNIENSEWKRIYKDGKILSTSISEEEGLHSIWRQEGSVVDDFYVTDEIGNVFRVDRGAL